MVKNHIIYNVYLDWSFDLSRAERSYLWTKDGQPLIDFTSGWNTTNLGWNHPEIAEALVAQAAQNTYAPMWTADAMQTKYADLLTEALPAPLTAVGRATGGTEANEMAIKTARAFTGRKTIVGFRETFHGQSVSTLALGFPGMPVQDFVQVTYPQTYRTDQSPEEILRKFAGELEPLLATGDVAAVVTESGIITGWGSTYVAPPGYLSLVRTLTEQYGALMILDEVGTGFSRCGSLFGMGLEGITPDIVTFAKAISNGAAPIGAMVTRDDIGEATFAKSILLSTFGWTPLACAAAHRTLQIHQRDKVWVKAEQDGRHIMSRLRKELADHPKVGDIRGIGMEIGIDIVKDKRSKEQDGASVEKIVQLAFRRNLHIVCDHHSNIQLMPPLTIDRTTLDEGLTTLIECIHAIE
ncbi:MAG TPA: aspartate aminotransferase family protein [Nitrospira sp.]|jgi:4-aminobutyrate aminotransferase-like enzyme|nr:aspartate aminotransferase family protein [Nitrospira sp.]